MQLPYKATFYSAFLATLLILSIAPAIRSQQAPIPDDANAEQSDQLQQIDEDIQEVNGLNDLQKVALNEASAPTIQRTPTAEGEMPVLEIPAEIVPSGQYVNMLPKTDAVSVIYVGMSGIDSIPTDWLADHRRFALDTRGLAIGKYGFSAVGSSKTGDQVRVDFAVIIGTPPPTPVPPGPIPIPPTPVPPGPTPIPPTPVQEGFRVIFVYESSANMTREQNNILYSAKIQDYLNRKTVKTDGYRGWRRWDKDVNLEKETPTFKKLWADAKPNVSALPAIIVTGDNKISVIPITDKDTEAGVLDMLQKIGGAL